MSLLDRIRAWREFAVTAVMWSEPRKAGYIQAVADCARTVEQWEHQITQDRCVDALRPASPPAEPPTPEPDK